MHRCFFLCLFIPVFCSPLLRGESPATLRVALRFADGGVVTDPAKSELLNASPAANTDKARLIALIDDRLKKLGPACQWNENVSPLNWDTTDVAHWSGPWVEGSAKLQAWLEAKRGDTDLGDLQYWSMDVIGNRLVDSTVDGALAGLENDTPLKLTSTEAYDVANSGMLEFSVASPVTAAELDAAVIGDNPSAGALLSGIRRGLSKQEGNLWWNADVLAAAGDTLRLRAIDPAEAWSVTSVFLNANASLKKIHVAGPVPVQVLAIKTAVPPTIDPALQFLIASYNLLPTDYFRGLRTTAPGEKYGFKLVPDVRAPGLYYINFTDAGLTPARFPPLILGLDAISRSESRLADLGYFQTVSGTPDAITVTFTAPVEATTAPAPAASAVPPTPPLPTATPKRNTLTLEAGRRTGTQYETSFHYQRTQIDGTDALEFGSGVVDNIAKGDFSYTRDYVAFPQLGRRLSLSAQVARDADSDRQVTDEAATEKKDQITGKALLELWRNFDGRWLNLEADLSAVRSRLQDKDDTSAPFDIKSYATTATARANYSQSGYTGSLPWTDAEVELGYGRLNGNTGGNYRWNKWSLTHREVWFESLRWETRGHLHVAGGDVPLAEMPSFGGEDSVRGFARDTARGKLAWSVQNELWFRLTRGFGLPEAAAQFIRRNLAVALLVDAGGLSSPTEHRVSLAASGGIGLRYVSGALTVRADWAHSLSEQGNVHNGSAAYFSIEMRPSL